MNKEPMNPKVKKGLIYFYIIVGLIVGGLALSSKSKSNVSTPSSSNTSSGTDDHKQKGAYKQGHEAGALAKTLNDNSGCSDEKAQEQGACVDQISKDLWCEGYNDGYYGR
jgi:hypothetical protein